VGYWVAGAGRGGRGWGRATAGEKRAHVVVQRIRIRARVHHLPGSGFRVQDLWFRVIGVMVQDLGFRVQGSGIRVQDLAFRVQGSGVGVWGLWYRV